MDRRLLVALLCGGIALGACSGGDASTRPPPTTAPPVTVAATPPADPAARPPLGKLPDVFAPIPDHQYVDVSDALAQATAARFLANPDARSVTALDGRWVTRAGKRIALASAVELDPVVAAQPGGSQGLVAAVTEGAQSSKQMKLSGEMVTESVDDRGMVTMAWLKGPLVLVVVGRNELRIIPVVSALIDANK